IRARRYNRAGHDADSCPSADRGGRDVARSEVGDHPQLHRILRRRAADIFGAHGIAVHRRVVMRGNVQRRNHVLRQNSVQRLEQRNSFQLEGMEMTKDIAAGLFDRDHAESDRMECPATPVRYDFASSFGGSSFFGSSIAPEVPLRNSATPFPSAPMMSVKRLAPKITSTITSTMSSSGTPIFGILPPVPLRGANSC